MTTETSETNNFSTYNPKWQARFEHFEHIHDPEQGYFSLIKSPKSKERLKTMGALAQNKINFNFWVLLFGPFWYMANGMLLKGLQIMFIIGIFKFAGAAIPGAGFIALTIAYLPIFIFASRASYDYYLSEIHGIKTWKGMWSKWWSLLVLIAVLCVELVVVGAAYMPSNASTASMSPTVQVEQQKEPGISDEQLEFMEDVSGVWGDGKGLLTVDLRDPENSTLTAQNAVLTVQSFGKYDSDNYILPMTVFAGKQELGIFTLRQVWNEDEDSYHLQLTLSDGTTNKLSFVRNL
ncbi:TPA: DUF2628 domain-containing protein [Vibrio parahaemolyticus]